MRERCEVRFRKRSKLARIGKNLYLKKDIFSFLIDCKNKGIVLNSKVTKDKKHRRYNFNYILKEEKDILKLCVLVGEDDPYLHFLLELQEKKKFHWKKAIACFLIPVMLCSYSIDAGEDRMNPTFEIEDDMLDELIDNTFFTIEEKIGFSFEKYNSKKESSLITKELISDFNFEGTLKSAFEGLYSDIEIEHKDSIMKYYDTENNVLDKELLSKIILQNSSDTSNVEILPYGRVVYDEIYMILTEVEKYIYYRLIDPDFDLKHFLCNLENLGIYKNMSYTPDQENVVAFMPISQSREKILVFNVFTEDKINEPYIWCSDTETIFHEMEHLYEMDCNCSSNKIYKSGASFIFSEDTDFYEQFHSTLYNNRLLMEWSAENVDYFYSSNFNCYQVENLIMHNLEFALDINPDYQFGAVATSIKNRDPLEMWQQFPYLYNEKEELIEYLLMLKSYDMTLYEDIENRYEYAKYACSKHIEIFYKNLLYANERSNNDMLFYNFAMIKVFEHTMREEAKILCDNEYEFDDYFLECRSQFKEYLSLKYDREDIKTIEDRVTNLTGYGLLEYIDYPDIVSDAKEMFCFHMLMKLEDYSYSDVSYIYVYK